MATASCKGVLLVLRQSLRASVHACVRGRKSQSCKGLALLDMVSCDVASVPGVVGSAYVLVHQVSVQARDHEYVLCVYQYCLTGPGRLVWLCMLCGMQLVARHDFIACMNGITAHDRAGAIHDWYVCGL